MRISDTPQRPVPQDARRPLGVDPPKGVENAYGGLVKTARTGGLKKVKLFASTLIFQLYVPDTF
ncbi:hypothetical protein KIN20_021141 [Parelaphostrongylus tenuis]|uniref:Uncharacterized protein n=1 Tax=Parelaphostrongylus tenuis TaxID=148309 RepID=A0AAD5QTZ5_PARTN|nr:hypothetical protein KIN20_021141 [Parelaphostrongylus tenuis]